MSNLLEYVKVGAAIAALLGKKAPSDSKMEKALAVIGATKEQAVLARSGMAELHAARAAHRKPDLSIEQGEALSIAGSLLSIRGKKASAALKALLG